MSSTFPPLHPPRRFNQTLPQPDGRPGVIDAYLARARDATAPGVVVLHEMLGVNADMQQVCDRLAAQGFHALCPDMYWRQRPRALFSEHDNTEREEALALGRSFDVDLGVNDLQHVMDWLRQLDGQTRKVGCVGYCLGGLLSYRVAACCRSDAAVVYYGVGIERHLDEVHTVACPLLIHFAAQDDFIPPSTLVAMSQVLRPVFGLELQQYPNTRHGFARRGGKHFDAGAAALADERSHAFLKAHLLPASGASGSAPGYASGSGSGAGSAPA
jgi:carboxymethylenebutenolidase